MLIKDQNKISNVIQLSRQAFGKYKLQIIILTILGFATGLLEAIGINTLIPLFSFITKSGDGATDRISELIQKFFIFFNINFNVTYLLIFISALFIFKALVDVLFSYIQIRITADYEQKTRSDLFANFLKTKWSFLLQEKLGHLENVLMLNVRFSGSFLGLLAGVIMTLTNLLVYILVAINISFEITLITLSLGLFILLIFKPFIYKIRLISEDFAYQRRNIAHYINEKMMGVKTIKAMAVTEQIVNVAHSLFIRVKKLVIRMVFLQSLIASSLRPASLIFICIIFAFSYRSPDFNFAALVAVIYLIYRIFQYIERFQGSLHKINQYFPYLKNVLDYQTKAQQNQEKVGGRDDFKFDNFVEFKNVDFSYTLGRVTLSDINFIINKGETLGIIGPSGSGKTTIVDLLLRLFKPTQGQILLDGKNIEAINIKKWRQRVGYVSQDIFLTNDSVENNIKFYDNSISKQAVIKAAKMANAYNFIQKLPEKFATHIGERGVLLSAGQRQRIVIARILARQPDILILDEATSALDNESELEIQRVIEKLKRKITVVVVAHRLTTVRNCDNLIVLKDGKVIEQGSPKQLLKDKDSYFYKVYNIKQ